MAIAEVQVLFAYTDTPRDTGWSETWYVGNVDIDSNVDADPVFKRFLNARLFTLAAGIRHTGCRVSEVVAGRPPAVPRGRATMLTDGTPFPGSSQVYNGLLVNDLTDFSGTVARLQLQCTPVNGIVYRTNHYLGGISDKADVSTDSLPVAGPFAIALKQFRRFVTTSAANVLLRVNDRSAANPQLTVTAYDPVTGRLTVPAHGLVTGNVVEVLGWKSVAKTPVFRGSYRVIVVDAATLTLKNASLCPSITQIGTIRPVSYIFPNVLLCTQEGWSTKKRGAPSRRSRGRRRTPTSSRA